MEAVYGQYFLEEKRKLKYGGVPSGRPRRLAMTGRRLGSGGA